MSLTAAYHTNTCWKGEHWGHIIMGNGPKMDFSAPLDALGHVGVFTPEEASVAAPNTFVLMMFIWVAEHFKLKMLFFDCKTEGTKVIKLDRTEPFTHLRYWPVIRIAAGDEEPEVCSGMDRASAASCSKVQPGD